MGYHRFVLSRKQFVEFHVHERIEYFTIFGILHLPFFFCRPDALKRVINYAEIF